MCYLSGSVQRMKLLLLAGGGGGSRGARDGGNMSGTGRVVVGDGVLFSTMVVAEVDVTSGRSSAMFTHTSRGPWLVRLCGVISESRSKRV
jgi:hypothetical protein